MKPRQDSRWPDAHVRLKKLYEARIQTGMSQEDFGQEYGIGSQGMVWQYLNGYTPLNYDSAAKFAEGLRCSIKDISPEMDEALRSAILPALGLKSWRRVAALVLAILLPQISPSPADANIGAISPNDANAVYYVKLLRSIFRSSFAFLNNLLQSKGQFDQFQDCRIIPAP